MWIFDKFIPYILDTGNINISFITLLIVLCFILLFSHTPKLLSLLSANSGLPTKNQLLNHELFIKAQKYYRLIEASHFGDTFKDEVFKDILNNKIKSTILVTRELIQEYELNNIELSTFEKLLYENNRRIIQDYNSNIKRAFIHKWGECLGEKVYYHVMNHELIGFNSIHDNQIFHVDKMIKDVICKESRVFTNNLFRFEFYLSEINSLLYTSMIDAENMFRGFNGKMEVLRDECYKSKSSKNFNS